MKRISVSIFFLAIVVAAFAQINIWRNGTINYSIDITSIDSITFNHQAPIEIYLSNITSSSVTAKVECSDPNIWFYTDVYLRDSLDKYGDDFAPLMVRTLEVYLQQSGYSSSDLQYLCYQSSDTYTYQQLMPDTEYYIYAFALDITTHDVLSAVIKKAFRTATEQEPILTINIDNLTTTTASVNVKSTSDTRYFRTGLLTQTRTDELGDNLSKFITDSLVNALAAKGYGKEYLSSYCALKEDYYPYAGLSPQTNYCIYAFSVDLNTATPYGKVYTYSFTTPEIADVDDPDLDFSFQIDNSGITVTPNNLNIDYVIAFATASELLEYKTLGAVWEYQVGVALSWGGLDAWDMLYHGVGRIDFNDPYFYFDQTWYTAVVAAWDVESQTRISDFYTFEFNMPAAQQTKSIIHNRAKTIPANQHLSTSTIEDESETLLTLWSNGKPWIQILASSIDSITIGQTTAIPVFQLEIGQVSSISVEVNITASDEQAYYFVDYILCSDADEYSDVELAQQWLQQLVTQWQWYYPSYPFEDVFLYQGSGKITFDEGLIGDTDYYMFCFAVDKDTRTLIGRPVKKAFKTMPSVTNSDMTFQIDYNTTTHIVTITPSDNNVTYYWGYFAPSEVNSFGSATAAWDDAVAKYGKIYSVHGKQTFSVTMQALEAGTHTLVIAGYDGNERTTDYFIQTFQITSDMLPW